MESVEKCKNCGESITYAYREWWDENDDNVCGETTHIPFVRITLAPTPVVPTMGPVAKWRKNGTGRLLPIHHPRQSQGRKLVTDA